jgi:ankyrin repeat protein
MKNSIIILSFLAAILSNSAMASEMLTVQSYNTIFQEGVATPLASAIAKGDITSVKSFIAYGIDINERNNDMTPLMLAARYNQVEIINVLLAHGANIKETNARGFNALKYAQLSSAKDAVALLTTQTTAIALNRKQVSKRSSI